MSDQLLTSEQSQGLTQKLDKPWFDASKINEFRTCPQKYFNRYVKGLTTEHTSHHLSFGIAIHKALENFYKGTFHHPVDSDSEFAREGKIHQGLAAFLSEYPQEVEQGFKTQLSGLEALACYVKKYNNEPFDVVAVEQSFLLDMGTFYYIGKMDLIVKYEGRTMPLDHKTTSRFGSTFESQFKIDTQITGYINATRKLVDPNCTSAMINAIRISKIIDIQESFLRKVTTRQAWELELWEEELRATVHEIGLAFGKGVFLRNGQSCNDYNSICPYYNLCLTHPTGRRPLEEANYRVEFWEPL